MNYSSVDITQLLLEEKSVFPKRPAVYFAIDSLGSIQYIGRSQNVGAM